MKHTTIHPITIYLQHEQEKRTMFGFLRVKLRISSFILHAHLKDLAIFDWQKFTELKVNLRNCFYFL